MKILASVEFDDKRVAEGWIEHTLKPNGLIGKIETITIVRTGQKKYKVTAYKASREEAAAQKVIESTPPGGTIVELIEEGRRKEEPELSYREERKLEEKREKWSKFRRKTAKQILVSPTTSGIEIAQGVAGTMGRRMDFKAGMKSAIPGRPYGRRPGTYIPEISGEGAVGNVQPGIQTKGFERPGTNLTTPVRGFEKSAETSRRLEMGIKKKSITGLPYLREKI